MDQKQTIDIVMKSRIPLKRNFNERADDSDEDIQQTGLEGPINRRRLDE